MMTTDSSHSPEELVASCLELVRGLRAVVPHYGRSRLYLEDIRELRGAARLHVQRRNLSGRISLQLPAEGGRCLRVQCGLPAAADTFVVLAAIGRILDSNPDARSIHEVAGLIGLVSEEERRRGGRKWLRAQREALRVVGEDWHRGVLPHLLTLARTVWAKIREEELGEEAREWLGRGRNARRDGRYETANLAFRRAVRAARRAGDTEAIALGWVGLGYTSKFQGRAADASKLFRRARRLARASGHRECSAYALHGLAALAIEEADAERATRYALAAFRAYGSTAPHVVSLVHDLGFLWVEQGYFARAFEVISAVVGRIRDPVMQMLAYSSLARSAAGAGSDAEFEVAWTTARDMVHEHASSCKAAQTYFNLAIAAHMRRQWRRAFSCLHAATELADTAGERRLHAQALAWRVALEDRAEVAWGDPETRPEVDQFAAGVLLRFGAETRSGAAP